MLRWLEIIGDALVVAFGVVLAYEFTTIILFGWFGFEPNKIILIAEWVVSFLIIALGIRLFLDDMKR